MNGCHLCEYKGCDDCMFETKVIEYNLKSWRTQEKYVKKKVKINWGDMRLKGNKGPKDKGGNNEN